MQFVKVQGCGNDFIILDQREHLNSRDLTANEMKFICHRYYGIGADGILIITTDQALKTPCMTIFNADASRAEMCGNGLRCVALYLYRRGYFSNKVGQIKTDAGLLGVEFISQNQVSINMGWPSEERTIKLLDQQHKKQDIDYMSWGNPHAVSFDQAIYHAREEYSQLWQPYFSQGINLSFASLVHEQKVILHVHERGCGWTQACGTGACATIISAYRRGYIQANQEIDIQLPGGTLFMKVDPQQGVSMRGDGVEVFTGELPL